MEAMEQRRAEIVSCVNEKGNVSFQELKKRFPKVSEMTLRTDLKNLDEEKQSVRIHGGAKSVDVVVGTDDLLGRRSVRNVSEKMLIAEKAVKLIRMNTTVFLDSGSTATQLAHIWPDQPNLIFTSGISCAMELARLAQPKLYLPGGEINRYSMSVCGVRVIEEVRQANYDTTFLGVTGYCTEYGFTCGSQEESVLKQAMIAQSEQVIALMDSSKVGIHSTFFVCGLDKIDMVISDGRLPETFLEECRANGVIVL